MQAICRAIETGARLQKLTSPPSTTRGSWRWPQYCGRRGLPEFRERSDRDGLQTEGVRLFRRDQRDVQPVGERMAVLDELVHGEGDLAP